MRTTSYNEKHITFGMVVSAHGKGKRGCASRYETVRTSSDDVAERSGMGGCKAVHSSHFSKKVDVSTRRCSFLARKSGYTRIADAVCHCLFRRYLLYEKGYLPVGSDILSSRELVCS